MPGRGSLRWAQRLPGVSTNIENKYGPHMEAGLLSLASIQRFSSTFTLVFLLSAFVCSAAHANTITAASCSQTDVTSAINSASDGDTVVVPGPCSTSWSSLTFPSTKGITLNGGGNVTVTSSSAVVIQSGSITSSRLTGFIFTGGGNLNNGDVKGQGNTSSVTLRIDNNSFTNGGTVIAIWGNPPALIDHNTFTVGGAAETIHNFGNGAGNTAGWADDIVPGGPNMVFIEDNTVTDTDPTYIAQLVEAYYGARTVIRHNTLNFTGIDEHGNSGTLNGVSARWWEIYANSFNAQGKAQCCYVRVRGGNGVIFGNTVAGNNNAPGNISLTEDIGDGFPGPCTPPDPDLYHVGRGINSTLALAYVWGNGSIPVGGDGCIRQGTEFLLSTNQPANLTRCESAADVSAGCPVSYNYVPYSYPHPLQGSPVAAPTGLAAVVH